MLSAVFPDFASSYLSEMSREDAALRPVSAVVDGSDFAVLSSDGTVESVGRAEEFDQAMNVLAAKHKMSAEEKVDGDDDDEHLLSLIGMDLDSLGNGPTTLMLFNIFTPDEVDFLKQLVGEEVVDELEKEDDEQLEQDDKVKDVVVERQPVRETLISYNHSSRRPPQFNPPPPPPASKNAPASSQGQGPRVSSTRESLEVYHHHPNKYHSTSNSNRKSPEKSAVNTAKKTTVSYGGSLAEEASQVRNKDVCK